jgi:Pretoxin HINT domain
VCQIVETAKSAGNATEALARDDVRGINPLKPTIQIDDRAPRDPNTAYAEYVALKTVNADAQLFYYTTQAQLQLAQMSVTAGADEAIAGLPCHSFSADTLVLLADGTRKRIADVAVGDWVVTTDPSSGVRTARPVVAAHRNHDSDLAELVVRDGDGRTATVHTTEHHRFWDDSRNEWVEAGSLATGDRLHVDGGSDLVTVVDVRPVAGSSWMFDLSISEIHAYFVIAGDDPVLVHNCPTFTNKLPGRLADEMATAEAAGVRPIEPGTAAFDKVINSGESVKFAVSENGALRVVPHSVDGVGEISHAIINGGAPVIAAGEAQIAGASGGYFGLTINNWSGHYMPSTESLATAIKAFKKYDILFLSGPQ